MKLNISNPLKGLQKCIEIDDEKRLLPFLNKRMGNEVMGDTIGDEFKGYTVRITGGNDKQGFPMMQGVMTPTRVRLLLRKGMKTYRQRRQGEMRRKSVRGSIVTMDMSVLALRITRPGPDPIPGLTDTEAPKRLGPKRAGKIKRMFNLTNKDRVNDYVVRRQIEGKNNKKAPKIQRLITPRRLQQKRRQIRVKKDAVKRTAVMKKDYMEKLGKFLSVRKAVHAKHAHGRRERRQKTATKA